MNTTNYALYEIHRHQILIAAISNPKLALFPDSYLYAIANRMNPSFFHSMWKSEEQDDPFEDSYEVSREEIQAVLVWLDERWLNKQSIPNFYDIEREFGGRDKRMSMINILRYLYLDKRFDEDFWKAILAPTNHPGEAQSICRPFSTDELQLV